MRQLGFELYCYSLCRRLRQGGLFLPLEDVKGSVVQPWGPRPLLETGDDLAALVILPSFPYEVIFPHVGFAEIRLDSDA